MPRLSTWMLRAALVHLGMGFTLGALILFNKGFPVFPSVWATLPLHRELLLFGWLVQLALGVAYWILPRWGTRRGATWLGWVAFATLNLGVVSAGTGGWLLGSEVLILAGRLLEAISALAFAIHAWPRIKPPGA